ncbi:MAG TPA: ABC transporter ATP-binding protein [Balneolaceae bacterium]|nr:ABC transporter ATP-binding protein [Balneolaceae bacterium]
MSLVAQHISKAFKNEQVLDDLNLQLDKHETLSILGRSGSGKTTLLKILAGLTAPDEGRVLINDQDVLSLAAHEREIVYLYQEALLFPHLNVFENVAFGLRLRKREGTEVNDRVDDMIQHLELDGLRDKMPHQLSGGQKQRVSFGRALITNPRVLLLDEPFGNLDADTRSSMQQLFKRIAKEFEITSVFVTHNVKEVILMGDRIAKLRNGQLRIYPTLEAFLGAEDNMVQEEIDFWQSVSNTKHGLTN